MTKYRALLARTAARKNYLCVISLGAIDCVSSYSDGFKNNEPLCVDNNGLGASGSLELDSNISQAISLIEMKY